MTDTMPVVPALALELVTMLFERLRERLSSSEYDRIAAVLGEMVEEQRAVGVAERLLEEDDGN